MSRSNQIKITSRKKGRLERVDVSASVSEGLRLHLVRNIHGGVTAFLSRDGIVCSRTKEACELDSK